MWIVKLESFLRLNIKIINYLINNMIYEYISISILISINLSL